MACWRIYFILGRNNINVQGSLSLQSGIKASGFDAVNMGNSEESQAAEVLVEAMAF